jgi:hypothetical protein
MQPRAGDFRTAQVSFFGIEIFPSAELEVSGLDF